MKIDRDGAYELDRIPSTIRAGSELLPFLSLGRGAHPHCPCPRCAPRSAPELPESRPRSSGGLAGPLGLVSAQWQKCSKAGAATILSPPLLRQAGTAQRLMATLD
jgi:hypothetical protein